MSINNMLLWFHPTSPQIKVSALHIHIMRNEYVGCLIAFRESVVSPRSLLFSIPVLLLGSLGGRLTFEAVLKMTLSLSPQSDLFREYVVLGHHAQAHAGYSRKEKKEN